MSALLKNDVWELDDAEAKSLATAAQRVSAHYDIGGSQKMIDWAMLIQTVGVVYGTRVMAISMEKKSDRKEQSNHAGQPVPFAARL